MARWESLHRWDVSPEEAAAIQQQLGGRVEREDRLGEVRLADNNGEYELHMYPGSGIIDFADTFRRIEATGYAGHYTAAFGTIDDMLRARPLLASYYDEP